MNELPRGWAAATLSDLCEEPEQRVPRSTEVFRYIDIGSIDRERKVISEPTEMSGAEAPSRARKGVRAGDVLVSMTRPNLNAVAAVPPELDGQIASTGLDVLRPTHAEPRWIYYAVRTTRFVDAMTVRVQGALYPAVRAKDVRGFAIPLAPLPEQKRIADKLDALLARVDACRDRLDRVPAILKHFRQAVTEAAVAGTLTEDWRSSLGRREHWDTGSMADLLDGKPRNGYSPKAVEWVTPVKALTLTATTSGRFLPEHFKFIDEPIPPESHLWLQPGDILIQRANTIEYVGTAVLYEGPSAAFIYPDLMMKARAGEKVDAKYLLLLLKSDAVRDHFRTNATGTAGNMPKINQQTVLTAPARWPRRDEQAEIVRRVETLFALADTLEARLATARALVERLTPALLSKAFRGELVPQDPNDEPASVLLARIRAAAEGAPAQAAAKGTPRKRAAARA